MKDPRAAILRELIADGWTHKPTKSYYYRVARGGRALLMYLKAMELLRGAYGPETAGEPGPTETGLLSRCLATATRVERLGMSSGYTLRGIGWRDTTGLHVELALYHPGDSIAHERPLNVWADSGSLPGLVVLGAWEWLNSAPSDDCAALIDALIDAAKPAEVDGAA